MANKVLFKELQSHTFTRCIKRDDNGKWDFAKRHEVPATNREFQDDNGRRYYLSDILRIGINRDNLGNIKSLFVYPYYLDKDTDEMNMNYTTVSNADEITKILDYLNQNKCNKGCDDSDKPETDK